MSKKNIGINFNLRFEKVQNLNPSFDLARVFIAYEGVNRNRCVISKEVFENAIPSLFNIPLVGYYIPEENDFGSHDIIVVTDDDGKCSVENATVPFGVIPESAEVGWETVVEEDGTEREYLYTDCLLWKRSYGYDCLMSQDSWNQSMEITVEDFEIDVNGLMVVKSMVFTALCILGNSVKPCFESASVQMDRERNTASLKSQFSLMVEDLKELISAGSAGKEPKTFNKEGGDFEMELTSEIINELLANAGLALEDINFEISEGMTREDFEAKLAEMKPATAVHVEEPVSFSASYLERRKSIENALDPVIEKDGGVIVSEVYFWLCDFDDRYAYVERTTWNNETGDREHSNGRFPYAFSDTTRETTLGDFEEMIVKWITVAENAEIEAARRELFELRDYKNEKLAEEHRADVDTYIASNFEKVSKTEEFAALGETIYELDRAALEEKLFAIKGRQSIVEGEKPSKNTVIRIPVSQKDSVSGRFDALFERYGKR